MKVEYSYYGQYPSLVVKGTDFLRAMKDADENYLLKVAVDGFAANFEVVSHFADEVNEAIQEWLVKNGDVIYTIKERCAGRTVLASWCEVYVQNGPRLIEVVFSDNGRDYSIHRKEVSD